MSPTTKPPRAAGRRGKAPKPKVVQPEVLPPEPVEPAEAEGAQGEVEPTEVELAAAAVEPAGAEVEPAKVLSILPSAGARDALQRYLSEAGRYPLLTREEEIALAERYQKTGDVTAAYKMVVSNLRLVVKIAFEYHRTAFNVLDLIQEGNIGLMQAVKKFDPYRGVKLSTYAAWWIRAFILRYIMENWRMVKLGTTQAQRKLFFNLKKEKEKLLAQGFDPGPKLLAERLDVTEQEVIDMDHRMSQDEFSLDAPVAGDSGQSHQDRLAGGLAPVDERLADRELDEAFHRHLGEFASTIQDEKERYIFERRLMAEEPLRLQDIGDHFGFTRERARQLEAKLTARLKTYMKERFPDFDELRLGREDEP